MLLIINLKVFGFVYKLLNFGLKYVVYCIGNSVIFDMFFCK